MVYDFDLNVDPHRSRLNGWQWVNLKVSHQEFCASCIWGVGKSGKGVEDFFKCLISFQSADLGLVNSWNLKFRLDLAKKI